MTTSRSFYTKLNAPFGDNLLTFTKNNQDYLRLFLSPIDPDPAYSLKEGKLQFRFNQKLKEDAVWGDAYLKLNVYNYFNIQAIIAKNFYQLKANFQARFGETQIPQTVVVDIPYAFLMEHSEIKNKNWNEKEKSNLTVSVQNLDTSLNRVDYSDIVSNASGLVYKQIIQKEQVNELPVSTPFSTAYGYSAGTIKGGLGYNPLSQNNNHVEILKYDATPNKADIGADIVISEEAPHKQVGYRRILKNKSDWYNLQSPDASKEAYLNLVKGVDYACCNAEKIAELFNDYARKGSGVSALLHCHLFRHNENVQVAREIAKDLSGPEYGAATNNEVALYLLSKFDALVAELNRKGKSPINPEGSFARRINYAIAQLTEGKFFNISEFRAFTDVVIQPSVKKTST